MTNIVQLNLKIEKKMNSKELKKMQEEHFDRINKILEDVRNNVRY